MRPDSSPTVTPAEVDELIVAMRKQLADAGVSYLIAIGVVIILGAVFGVVWREHRRRNPSKSR